METICVDKRDLERDGLLSRTVYATTPPQVEYALTQLGRSVADPLRQIREWSVDHMEEIEAARGVYDQRRLSLVVVESHDAAVPGQPPSRSGDGRAPRGGDAQEGSRGA